MLEAVEIINNLSYPSSFLQNNMLNVHIKIFLNLNAIRGQLKEETGLGLGLG